MNTPTAARGWLSLSVLTFVFGLLLIAGFLINISRHAPPSHLATVQGRVTEVRETRGALVVYLVPSGDSSDAGRYFRYSHASGASGVVAIQLREAASKVVTLRYSEANGEVFEILDGEHVIRSLSETLSSTRTNNAWLFGVGAVLVAGAARPAFKSARRWLTSHEA